uniref:EamA domain-containing protein n=1 Tax=Ditylum brightwellii TaxID=49249 RepID=A0A7S4RIV3_9STRA
MASSLCSSNRFMPIIIMALLQLMAHTIMGMELKVSFNTLSPLTVATSATSSSSPIYNANGINHGRYRHHRQSCHREISKPFSADHAKKRLSSAMISTAAFISILPRKATIRAKGRNDPSIVLPSLSSYQSSSCSIRQPLASPPVQQSVTYSMMQSFQNTRSNSDDIMVLKASESGNNDNDVNGDNQTLVFLDNDQSSLTSSSSLSDMISNIFQELPLESVILLNAVAVIWGTQHAVIKIVVDDCDASSFSFARFALGALIASPYTPSILPFLQQETHGDEDEKALKAWRWGLEMGMWMFLGYAFQAVGLAFTTAQRSGFLLYLNVKFVPFFARILLGRKISIPTWVSALTALTGTALLSFDGTTVGFNIGDAWSVAAAAASAMFILRLETATAKVSDSSALNAACLWTVAGATLVWSLADGYIASLASTSSISAATASLPDMAYIIQSTVSNVIDTIKLHPVALIYLGGVTTALANYIQTRAQKNVTAERASLIYAMDPVYGAVFANLLLGETLGPLGIGGAGLITVAAATNAFLDLGSKEGKEEGRDSGRKEETVVDVDGEKNSAALDTVNETDKEKEEETSVVGITKR